MGHSFINMRFLTLYAFVSAITMCASAGDESIVFRKCCPRHQSLVKVTEIGLDIDALYHCVDREIAASNYNVTKFSTFVVANSVVVEHGIPDENCDMLQMHLITDSQVEMKTSNDVCYDRLVSEIENDTSVLDIPKTVSLICVHNKTESTPSYKSKVSHIRKCCPKGKSYDTKFHSCRKIEQDSGTDEWLMRLFNISRNYVYEVEVGLHCSHDAYSVELSEEMFTLEVNGNTLKYLGSHEEGKVPVGEWCIDRELNGQGLVARVCSEDCSSYGAYCIRKCCPLGQHYKPFNCGTFRSVCVPDNSEVFFNLSSYLDPLKNNDDDDLFDTMGIRVNLNCPEGKFALNASSELDRHWLTRGGQLLGPTSVDPHNYCLEAFDRRDCPVPEIAVTGLSCFFKGEQKNFIMAAVINTLSAICLVLTLIVYCSLPELRNLHGRTIISHVSTMCFAYSCLARAQYNKVESSLLCIMIAYGIYFGFVAAFIWLNVMCFDIWWTFGSIRNVQPLRKAGTERRRFLWYSLYAWGMSLLFTVVVLLLDLYPVAEILDASMGHSICWFGSIQNTNTDWPHYILFVIPMGLMTCVNLVLWLLTARHCAQVKSEVHRLQAGSVGDRAKRRFRIDRSNYILTGKLWVVMGAGWFSELLSTLTHEPVWLWTIIDLVNQLQGVFIFLILVFKPKVYYLIKKRLGLEKPDAQKNGTASTGRTSSTFLSRTISTDERTNLRTSLPNNGVKRA